MGKHAKPKPVRPRNAPRKARTCMICNGTGTVEVPMREPLTGKYFDVTQICPCRGK